MVRVYTVEEAKALPPLTADEVQRGRNALEELAGLRAEILAQRGGVPFTIEEILELLDRDRDYELAPAAK